MFSSTKMKKEFIHLLSFQALEVIKQLKESDKIAVKRAQMRLRIVILCKYYDYYDHDN